MAATTKFGPRQLEELWVMAGGSKAEAGMAAAIALAESGGDPGAEGHNTNGTIDRGLWQINSVHGALSTTNVLDNARAAVKIQSESRGWEAWTTYKTGAYGAFLPFKRNGLTPAQEKPLSKHEALEPQSGLFGIVEGKVPGFSKEGKTEEKLEHGLEHPGGWVGELLSGFGKLAITGVLLIAGAVLVVYGIMVAVRPRESALSIPLPKAVPIPV